MEALAGWHAPARGESECIREALGLGTFTRACSVELWKPVIEETLDFFGPARCMFGSNFPIEKLWTSYGDVKLVTKAPGRIASGD